MTIAPPIFDEGCAVTKVTVECTHRIFADPHPRAYSEHDSRDHHSCRRVIRALRFPRSRKSEPFRQGPSQRDGPAGRSARSIRPGRVIPTGRHIPGSSPARRRRCRACSRFIRPRGASSAPVRRSGHRAASPRKPSGPRTSRAVSAPMAISVRTADKRIVIRPWHDRLGVSAAIEGSGQATTSVAARPAAATPAARTPLAFQAWESTFPTVEGSPSGVIGGSSTLPTNGRRRRCSPPARRERRHARGSSRRRPRRSRVHQYRRLIERVWIRP